MIKIVSKINIKKTLGFLGLIVLIYLIYKAGPIEIIKKLSDLNWSYLYVGLFFLLLSFILSAYRLMYLMPDTKNKLSFIYFIKMFFVGNFYSAVTPSQVGGVFMKTIYLKEALNRPFTETVGAVLLDKIIEFVALLAFGIVAALFLLNYLSSSLIFINFILLISLLIGLLVFTNKKLTYRLLRTVFKLIIPDALKEKAKISFHSFYDGLPSCKYLIKAFILSLLGWLCLYTFVYFTALSLSVSVLYYLFMSVMATSTIVGLLPISFGGLGVREGAMVYLLGLLGINTAAALTISVVAYLIAKLIPATIGAIISFIYKYEKIEEKNYNNIT